MSKPANWSRALLAVAIAVSTITHASGQIAAWDFSGEDTANATSTAEVFNSRMDSSNTVTRGTGATASAAGNSFRTEGFLNNGIATTNTDYFQTTLSAATGYSLSLSTIDARFAGTGSFAASPGVSSQFAYSLDGTTFTLIGSPAVTIGSPGTMTPISLTGITALQNVADTVTVTIRYYASGQTTTGGWGFTSATAGSYGLAFGGTLSPAVASDMTPPSIVSKSPIDGTLGVLPSANLSLTFDESIVAGTGIILIKKSSDHSTVESITVSGSQVTISGASATINPGIVLDYSSSYYVEVPAGTFKDAAGNLAPAIAGATTWNFTTRNAPQVVINQYYEGVNNSRFIELKNLTGNPIDLSAYRLTAWLDSDPAGNQAWKSGTGTTTRVTALNGKTLPANGYFLIADTGATSPAYAVSNNDLEVSFSSGASFSGASSVVLYSSATNDLDSIADAISITATEGTDISFFRLTDLVGFDIALGTSILGYPSIWGTKTLSEVASASVTDAWYLQASQPPQVLTLEITPSTTFSEGAGAAAASCKVTRSGPTTAALVVTITVSDTTEANAQATVTIPKNSDNATFSINAVNDLYLDGNVQVSITASQSTYSPATQQITVQDELTDVPFPVVINEIDSDQASSDAAEFIELYNNSSTEVSLDGVVLVFYNGGSSTSYLTINLSGKTIPGNGFFVIGNPAVANVGATFPVGTLQNGEDAVALYFGPPSSFPNGTAVATLAGKLVDALVYGTNDSTATAMIAALTPGQLQTDEGASPASETVSLSRLPNGGAAFNSALYVAQTPSPGTTNILTAPNTYSNWINSYFSGVTDQLIVGFGADPDGDGVRNGVEALTGGNPNAPGVFATTEFTKTGNTFTFLYPQDKTPPSGVTAAYEWSTNMVNWQSSGGSSGGVTVTLGDAIFDSTDPEVFIYKVTATVTVGTASSLFVRVAAKK